MKGIVKFIISSLVIVGLIIVILGIVGIVFGALATGLTFISRIIPIKIGIVLIVILAIAINLISKKISHSKDETKFSLFKEIVVIKNISESLLKNGHFKTVYVKFNESVNAIGFTNGEIDSSTKKIFVFIPTTPIASTGITFLVDPKNIEYSGLSTREALITIVTGGLGSKSK